MTERTIRINIDPTGAKTGAQQTVKSLEEIRKAGAKSGSGTRTAMDEVTKATKRTGSAADAAADAVKGYGRSTKSATEAVKQASGAQDRFSAGSRRLVSSLGASAGGFRSLASAAAGFFGIMGGAAILGGMTRQFMAFETTLSEVQAVTRATGVQMQQLSATARELGATTRFSAAQAAEGMAFLGRAGFSTQQITATIGDTLNLAAAGALDLGTAADIASNVLTGFNMKASEMGRVADVIAATAAKSNTSVEQMGQAMKFAAPVAAAMGVSIEQASASIGALSDAGLQAEMAGTGLRMAMISLANPTKKARDTLAALGLSVEDVNPMTNDLATIMHRLKDANIQATDAMQIAGARGGTALTVLSEAGEKIERLTGELNNSKGAAVEMASVMSDNLQGGLTTLSSKMSEFNLKIMAGKDGIGAFLRDGVDLLINNFDSVESAIIAVTASVGGLTAIFAALNATMLLNPFVLIATLIGGVTFALLEVERQTGLVSQTWREFTASASGAFVGFSDMVSGAWNSVTGGIADGVNLVIGGFQSMVNAGVDLYNGLMTGFVVPIEEAFFNIPRNVALAFDEVISKVEGAINTIADKAPDWLDIDPVKFGRVGSDLGEAFKSDFEKKAYFSFDRATIEGVKDTIAAPFVAGGEMIGEAADSVRKSIDGWAKSYQDSAKRHQDAKNHANEFASVSTEAEKAVKGATTAVEDLSDELTGNAAASDDATKAAKKFVDETIENAKKTRDATEAMRHQTEVAKLMEVGTHDARVEIIDLKEAQELAGVEAEIHEQKLKLLDDALSTTAKGAIRDYIDALEDQKRAIGESFDQDRIEEFADENEKAAERVEEAWSNTTSAIGGLFDELFGKGFDKLGKFGGIAEGIATDLLGQLTGSTGSSIGSIIGGLVSNGIVDSVTSSGGSIMDFGSITDLFSGGLGGIGGVLTNFGSTLNTAFSNFLPGGQLLNLGGMATNFATSQLGGALGLSSTNFATGAASMGVTTGEAASLGFAAGDSFLTGGGSMLATGASQLGSIAVAPFLGMLASGIIGAYMKPDDPRSVAGMKAIDGRANVDSIVTENDGDPAIAKAMGESAAGLINGILDITETTLTDGTLLGNVGSLGRVMGASIEGGVFGQRDSTLGLDSLPVDTRRFEKGEDGARAAIADFVSRTLIKQIQDGTIEGLSEGAGDTMMIGLGNIARNIEQGLSEAEFETIGEDMAFLASFDKLAESLVKVDNAALTASERADMAAESQAKFNEQLATFRGEAAASAAESVSPLAGLGEFIDRAERLFDPTGGNRFQLRNAIGGGRVDLAHSGVRENVENSNEYRTVNDIYSQMFSDRSGSVLPNQIEVFDEMVELIDQELGENGRLSSAFRQNGETLEANLSKLTDILEDRGVEIEAVIDDFFVRDDRDRIAEAGEIVRGQVDEFFDGLTESISGQIDGPLNLFEEIVPSLSPVVEQFEMMKAQVEATRPELEAINEDFARLGLELIDIDGKIAEATGEIRVSAQDHFLAGLGIAVNGEGQVEEARVDFGAINSLAETVASLDQNAATLFEEDERGIFGDVQNAINDTLLEGIAAILGNSEDQATTLEQIRIIFGDRVDGLDLTSLIDSLTPSIDSPTSSIDSGDSAFDATTFATDQLAIARAEIMAREEQIESIKDFIETLSEQQRELENTASIAGRLADGLLEAADDLSLNRSSSFASPKSQVEGLAKRFEELSNIAKGDSTDPVVQDAISELPGLSREYQAAAADYYGNSDEFYSAQEKIQNELRTLGRDQRSIETQALSELQAITSAINAQTDLMDSLQSQQSLPEWVAGSDGQYIATGAGDIEAGFDLGRNADANSRILAALRAAGLDVSGFGEGQLGELRQSSPLADQVVSALGFANGGAFDHGVVVEPTPFDMGVMGEAGPEAIMPLTRVGGQLGVVASGSDSDREIVRELRELRAEIVQIKKINQAHAIDDRETNEVVRSKADRDNRNAILERAS